MLRCALLLALALPVFAQRGPVTEPDPRTQPQAVAAPTNCGEIVTASITLTSDWVEYGEGTKGVEVYKDCVGVVHMSGILKHSLTPLSPPSPLFVLPPGFRPTAFEMFVVATSQGPATILIPPEGDVVIIGTGFFTSLSGITFRAAK